MCSCVFVIKQTEHVSRKERDCMINEFIGDTEFERDKLSFSELRALVVYERNKRKIKPGDKYIRQFNKMGGLIYEWIAKKDIFDIICKYDLMPCSC